MSKPINLSYETTLADLVEPAFRLYTRRKSYRVNKWRNMALCSGGFTMLAFFGFHSKETISLPLVCVAAAAWGALMIHFTYPRSVRRSLEKYIVSEIGPSLPFDTECQLSEETLTCTSRGATATYRLSDLDGVTNDGQRVELSFGEKALCLIPLRAFEDEEQQAEFIDALPQA